MLLGYSEQMGYRPFRKILFSVQNVLEKYYQTSGCFQLVVILNGTAISYIAWQFVIDNHYIRRKFLTNALVLHIILYT